VVKLAGLEGEERGCLPRPARDLRLASGEARQRENGPPPERRPPARERLAGVGVAAAPTETRRRGMRLASKETRRTWGRAGLRAV
jgi:hypothetical protein